MALRHLSRLALLALIGWSGSALRADSLARAGPVDHHDFGERLVDFRRLFVANVGQTDPAVAFYAPTAGGFTFVTREGQIVHSLRATGNTPWRRWSVVETLTGGAPPRPLGRETSDARATYCLGNDPSTWRIAIATYGSVTLGEVWPGVDVSLRTARNGVEKLFVLSPGTSPDRIRVRLSGAASARVDQNGQLTASTGLGPIAWSAPVAYQDSEGRRRRVPVRYWAKEGEYGFRLGAHDPALPVTIDPLLQATYLGGSLNDYAFALAIHPRTREVYVTGRTESLNFPGVAGGPQTGYAGGWDDAFIARFNPTLTALEQTTYFGGNGIDFGTALAVHPGTGEVFVAGQAASTNLPGTEGGAQPLYAGTTDAFVARLDADLTRLIQVTYLGGTWGDGAEALAIHPTTGEVFVAGWTVSSDFPRAEGGAQPERRSGNYEAFVARLDTGLTRVSQATYLGGSLMDVATDLAVDAGRDEVILCGMTESDDLPGTAGAAQSTLRGISDAFVSRLGASLTRLERTTYLGGSDAEWGIALAIDPAGHIFVGGDSSSPDLPARAEDPEAAYGGFWDGFVARIRSDLGLIEQTRLFGGELIDFITALTLDPATGELLAVGETTSTDLPGLSGAAQSSYGGGVLDAFVARFTPGLDRLSQATYLGGRDRETAYAVAVEPTTGDVIVAGDTRSEDFPKTAGGAQASYGGGDLYGGDAFVARLSRNIASPSAGAPARTRGPSPPRIIDFR
jgi:hypothetical protein